MRPVIPPPRAHARHVAPRGSSPRGARARRATGRRCLLPFPPCVWFAHFAPRILELSRRVRGVIGDDALLAGVPGLDGAGARHQTSRCHHQSRWCHRGSLQHGAWQSPRAKVPARAARLTLAKCPSQAAAAAHRAAQMYKILLDGKWNGSMAAWKGFCEVRFSFCGLGSCAYFVYGTDAPLPPMVLFS